jgi:hypothetical protein
VDLNRIEWRHEHHQSRRSWELATGTLACPSCDAPVLPSAGGMSPADPLACGFCGTVGAVSEFLSLAEPTRPTRVTVRVSPIA